MDIEKGAICSVLRRPESTALYDAMALGLDTDMFRGPGKDVWVFMLDYAKDHGGTVTEDVVKGMFPEFKLPDKEFRPGEPSFYIQQMRQRNLAQSIQQAMKQASEFIVDREPIQAFEALEKVVAEAQGDVRGALDVNLVSAGEDLLAKYDAIRDQDGVEGFATPWDPLTKATLGWKRGELIVISARPGTGKSWFAVLLADAIHNTDNAVPLIVSREMSVDQFMRRIAAQRARIPHMGFRAGDLSTAQYERFTQMVKDLEGKPDYWISGNDAALGVQGLAAKIDRMKPDVVIVDGLYLMRDDNGESGWEGITNLTRDLKQLALRKQIPIIVTSQLNRGSANRRASLANLAYSDSIGMDADVVIALFQDEELRDEEKLIVKLLKQREGMQLEFSIKWDLSDMVFDTIVEATGLGGGSDDDDIDEEETLGFASKKE